MADKGRIDAYFIEKARTISQSDRPFDKGYATGLAFLSLFELLDHYSEGDLVDFIYGIETAVSETKSLAMNGHFNNRKENMRSSEKEPLGKSGNSPQT